MTQTQMQKLSKIQVEGKTESIIKRLVDVLSRYEFNAYDITKHVYVSGGRDREDTDILEGYDVYLLPERIEWWKKNIIINVKNYDKWAARNVDVRDLAGHMKAAAIRKTISVFVSQGYKYLLSVDIFTGVALIFTYSSYYVVIYLMFDEVEKETEKDKYKLAFLIDINYVVKEKDEWW